MSVPFCVCILGSAAAEKQLSTTATTTTTMNQGGQTGRGATLANTICGAHVIDSGRAAIVAGRARGTRLVCAAERSHI